MIDEPEIDPARIRAITDDTRPVLDALRDIDESESGLDLGPIIARLNNVFANLTEALDACDEDDEDD